MISFFKLSLLLFTGFSGIIQICEGAHSQTQSNAKPKPAEIISLPENCQENCQEKNSEYSQFAFIHNFCESRLQNNKPPELWNAYTSLFVSIIPFIRGFPQYPYFYNVACMLTVNGFASFYYHYTLNWFGKQVDEISMILANYFGLWGLINMYYNRTNERNHLNRYNTAFMFLFLSTNTLIQFDFLFPTIFGIYVGGSLVMIHKIGILYDISYKRYLFVSLIGTLSWIISEHHCTETTKYGHPIWHVLFPLGFYHLLLNYDTLKVQNDKKR